jgi:hypothetical protein
LDPAALRVTVALHELEGRDLIKSIRASVRLLDHIGLSILKTPSAVA